MKYYKSSYLKETLNTTGVGITGTLGLIYRFTDEFRGGISLQLPTFYSLSDEYSYEVGSDITIGKYSTSSDIGTFKYSIVTPSRTTLSLAYIFGKQGFISADYEYIDYSGGRINTNYEGVRQKNEEVKNVLHHASNFRIGGEYRIGMASLRAGFDWYGSPYENGMAPVNYNGSNRMLSLGFGIRDENYFVDLGFQNQLNNFFHLPYALKNANVEGATIQNYRNNFILTLGTKF